MIGRRHVFHIGGYDPITPEKQLGRFRRSLSRFERTWNASSRTSEIVHATDISSSWELDACGPNWTTRVTFEMLRWDDLVLDDSRRRMLSRLYHSTLTLFDFTANGTLFRYFRANWKYAGFFLFPYVSIAVYGLGSAAMAYVLTRLSGLTGLSAALLGIFVAVLTCTALIHWLDPRRRLKHALDDAIFSGSFFMVSDLKWKRELTISLAVFSSEFVKTTSMKLWLWGIRSAQQWRLQQSRAA